MNEQDRISALRVYSERLTDISNGAEVLGYEKHSQKLKQFAYDAQVDFLKLARIIEGRLKR